MKMSEKNVKEEIITSDFLVVESIFFFTFIDFDNLKSIIQNLFYCKKLIR